MNIKQRILLKKKKKRLLTFSSHHYNKYHKKILFIIQKKKKKPFIYIKNFSQDFTFFSKQMYINALTVLTGKKDWPEYHYYVHISSHVQFTNNICFLLS